MLQDGQPLQRWFNEKLKGMRNYNLAFIEGSKNLRASNFTDHTASEMHTRAMLLLKKEESSDVLNMRQ